MSVLSALSDQQLEAVKNYVNFDSDDFDDDMGLDKAINDLCDLIPNIKLRGQAIRELRNQRGYE